jgi:hypothetical protein
MTACTTGYCHPILAGCDDSSVIIACHEGAWLLLEEERQRDLPSNLSLVWLNFVTARQRMCHLILDRGDGMAIPLPSSLHILEEH